MLKTMRSVVSTLRPGPLDEGLIPAAEWLLATLPERAGLACSLVAQGDLPTGQAVRTAAFRILQEALTNVVRHAHARTVRVMIALDGDGRLHLEVIDDGVGVDPDAISAARSFGLRGMRERARAFRGRIDFRQTEGGGTTLLAVLDANPERATGEGANADAFAPELAGRLAVEPVTCRSCCCGGAPHAVCRNPAPTGLMQQGNEA